MVTSFALLILKILYWSFRYQLSCSIKPLFPTTAFVYQNVEKWWKHWKLSKNDKKFIFCRMFRIGCIPMEANRKWLKNMVFCSTSFRWKPGWRFTSGSTCCTHESSTIFTDHRGLKTEVLERISDVYGEHGRARLSSFQPIAWKCTEPNYNNCVHKSLSMPMAPLAAEQRNSWAIHLYTDGSFHFFTSARPFLQTCHLLFPIRWWTFGGCSANRRCLWFCGDW